MKIESLYDPRTSTLTYVVWDEATHDAVIIDPVLDFDDGRIWHASIDAVMDVVTTRELTVRGILETHAHADHLTGSAELRARTGAPVVIGDQIVQVQETFAGLFGLGDALPQDGSQFDRLVADGEIVRLGSLEVRAIHTPGHTPACVTWQIEDALFTGDALFMPDQGTGRCDFPGGSADALYASVHDRLYALPDETRVFVGHDYQPGGRAVAFASTLGEAKRANVQLAADTPREAFVAARQARDATLGPPRLLFPSLQVNIRAGALPRTPEEAHRWWHENPIVGK